MVAVFVAVEMIIFWSKFSAAVPIAAAAAAANKMSMNSVRAHTMNTTSIII